MRVHGHNGTQGPSWLLAVVIFVVLILLLQLFRDSSPGGRPLAQQFAASRPEPGGVGPELPPLPSSVGNLARTAAARIGSGGTGAALTPVAQGGSLQVEITGIRESGGGLQISGSVVNQSQQPLPVTLAAFQFTDGTGTVYAAENAAATTLAPGQRAPLDLTLPVQDARQLTLAVEQEGQPPIHMVLKQDPE